MKKALRVIVDVLMFIPLLIFFGVIIPIYLWNRRQYGEGVSEQ